MKSINDILTDVFHVIENTPINALNGGIFKRTRPTDSELQDCVINVINGGNIKFIQDGALYVKLFYPDIKSNNTYSEDGITGSEFEYLLFSLSEKLLKLPDYSFEISSREIYTEAVENIHQHFALLKINFIITQ